MKEVLAESEGLHVHRPERRGVGRTMTIAKRSDYIQKNPDGTVDTERTIEELKKY